ncbi:MAG TPA: ATP-binding cassette domain-containing protein, partial [Bacteroidota bacterium]|nr:ATP-binding cassette domain-containing protein [Bacteroidota bacterium]
SGKSTFLNIVAGILSPDSGFVKLFGRDVTNLAQEKREIVLVTPDSYIPHLTVEKHLRWGARVKNLEIDPAAVSNVRSALGISYEGKLAQLSLGMRERVALGTALLSSPRLILIDETFSNIDNREQFISEFRKLSSEAKIHVIFTTQFEDDSKVSDHSYLMNAGKLAKLS